MAERLRALGHKLEKKVVHAADHFSPGLGEKVEGRIAETHHKIHDARQHFQDRAQDVKAFKEDLKQDFRDYIHHKLNHDEHEVLLRYRHLGTKKTLPRRLTAVILPLLLLQHWAVEIRFREHGNYLFELVLPDIENMQSKFNYYEPGCWDDKDYKLVPFGPLWGASTTLSFAAIKSKGEEIIAKREEYRLLVSDCHCFAIDLIYGISPRLSKAAGVYLAKIAETFVVRPLARIPSGFITDVVKRGYQLSAPLREFCSKDHQTAKAIIEIMADDKHAYDIFEQGNTHYRAYNELIEKLNDIMDLVDQDISLGAGRKERLRRMNMVAAAGATGHNVTEIGTSC